MSNTKTRLATVAAATAMLPGCASLNSQALPGDWCGKAGYVPVKVEDNSNLANTFKTANGTKYGLISTHDPVLQTRQESAVAGSGIGLVAAEVFKFHPVAGLLAGAIAGSSVGNAEGGASYTTNVRQCFSALNRGDYDKVAITLTNVNGRTFLMPGKMWPTNQNGYYPWAPHNPINNPAGL